MTKIRNSVHQPILRTTVLIFLCFLLTSTGYLAWLYHLMELVPANTSDILTMVMGYSLQALGLGIFALVYRVAPSLASRRVFAGTLIIYMVFLVPAILSPAMAWTIIFGLLSNLLCGIIAGFYLHFLTLRVEHSRRALAFGIGYGASTLASWLLSLTGGTIYYSAWILIVCAVLTILTVLLLLFAKQKSSEEVRKNDDAESGDSDSGKPASEHKQYNPSELRNLILLAGTVVLFFSLVNNIGFSFPTEDLVNGVNLELSRLFYAAGLVIAGLVGDRSRKYGSLCALAALVFPFIMLALRGEPLSSMIFWALGYFTFGFYSVFRVILFSDIAETSGILAFSGMGLLVGRIGDAAGKGICIVLQGRDLFLIIAAAVLFIISVFFYFRLYQHLYVPAADQRRSEREIFNNFASQHDLSAREREVLRLLLEEKTSSEIASALYVSDSTVKYHIHNLLKKTGAKNRLDLIELYHSS